MAKEIPILVIEDNEQLRELIGSSLANSDFDVCTAEDSFTGMEAAYKQRPRVIIMDLTEDLRQAVSTFKLNQDTSDIPIIILSEGDSIAGGNLAAEICADNYITKPFKAENLAEIIRLKLENCEAALEATSPGKKISVLVVDDEDYVRTLVQHHLRKAGFEVHLAADGFSGITAARKYKPKLILLDVMMPEMDGLEVLLNLKWNKKTRDIPVFMLTARKSVEDMDRAFANRADDYLTKPFKGEELGNLIKEKLAKLATLKKLR